MSAPANDNWANAELITGSSGSLSADNTDATSEAGEPISTEGPGDGPWQSIWYKWVCPATAGYRFGTQGSRLADLSGMDTVLAVYTGSSLAGLHEVTSNDDWYWSGDDGRNSHVQFDAVHSVTYYISVSGYDSDEFGSIQLAWDPHEIPDAPTITAPAEGAVVTVEDEGADTVTISWTPDPIAVDGWEGGLFDGDPEDDSTSSIAFLSGTGNTVDLPVPFINADYQIWIRTWNDTEHEWSHWGGPVHVHLLIGEDTPLDCYEQEVMADSPTAFWLGGEWTGRSVPDRSGNGHDLDQYWYPGGLLAIADRISGIFSPGTDIFAEPFINRPGSSYYTPNVGQTILLVVMAADVTQSNEGPLQAAPDIGLPSVVTWRGPTAPDWSLASTYTFEHDIPITPDPGYYYQYHYRVSLFSHVVTADDPSTLKVYFPIDHHPYSYSGLPGFPVSTWIDTMWEINLAEVRPLVIDRVLWTNTSYNDVNWPAVSPVPTERYATLNMAISTGLAEVTDSPTNFTTTGTRFNVDDRVDARDRNEVTPTSGYHWTGVGTNNLAMLRIVVTGLDAEYWDTIPANPFCTLCDDMVGASVTSSQRRSEDTNSYYTHATSEDLYGSMDDPHDFALEALIRYGTAGWNLMPAVELIGNIDLSPFGGQTNVRLIVPDYNSSPHYTDEVEADCWHHIVDTYDATTNISTFWFDGSIRMTHTGVRSPPQRPFDTLNGFYVTLTGGGMFAAISTYDHTLSRRRVTARFRQLCKLCNEPLSWSVNGRAIPVTVNASGRFTNKAGRIRPLPTQTIR